MTRREGDIARKIRSDYLHQQSCADRQNIKNASLPPKSLTIIGGGFSGASLALHLAALTDPSQLVITIIEPRKNLGAGLAYSTQESAFRLNVLSDRMSIYYDDKPHFARWIAQNHGLDHDPQATTQNGQVYAQRSLFGAYMAAQIQPLLDNGHVHHVQACATSAVPRPEGGYQITTDQGATIEADFLSIAASHPRPALPAPLRSMLQAAEQMPLGFISDPYQQGVLENLVKERGKNCSVLIIGAGLTSADMIAGLSHHGHSGPITVLSRHGLRARPNLNLKPDEPKPPRLFGDFLKSPHHSATQLLQHIRKTIRQAAEQSVPWQSVIDTVRDQGREIWFALPLKERLRIVRHLRIYWDAHRFRLATQTNDTITELSQTGRLQFLAAHLVNAHYAGHEAGFTIDARLRGQSAVNRQKFDAIIITTGPAHGDIIEQSLPLATLRQAGLIAMDPTGLGLHTSATMRAIDQWGEIVDTLFIAGPLARGTFGELMGAPEVTRYTQELAEIIKQACSETDRAGTA